MIYFQNIRVPAPLGQGCATSPTAARAGWREDSTLRDILRTTLMTSTAPTCFLQPPVSRSHQSRGSHLRFRNDLCVSKIAENHWKNCFRSKLCLIISRSGRTTSTPTAAWATGRPMAGRSAMTTGLRSLTFTWISPNSFWEGERRMKITLDSCKCRGFSPRCHLLTRPHTQDPSKSAHFIINPSSGHFLLDISSLNISDTVTSPRQDPW